MGKSKYIREVTPKFTALWPKLNEPDTKFDANGVWEVIAILDPANAGHAAYMAKCDGWLESARVKAEAEFRALSPAAQRRLGEIKADPIYTEQFDKATDEPTGMFVTKFKMKAKYEHKKRGLESQRPTIIDSSRRIIVEKSGKFHRALPEITTGSSLKVGYSIRLDDDGNPGYFIPGSGKYGVTRYLDMVQIISISEGSGLDQYGFGDEDGYQADDADESGFHDESTGDASDTPEANDDF